MANKNGLFRFTCVLLAITVLADWVIISYFEGIKNIIGFFALHFFLFVSFLLSVFQLVRDKINVRGIGLVVACFLVFNFVSGHMSSSLTEFSRVDTCLDRGGTWDSRTDDCNISPERKIQNHILDVRIPVPGDEKISALLVGIKSRGQSDVAYGNVVDGWGEKKGVLLAFYWRLEIIAPDLFVMPFSVESADTKSSGYLGLFSWQADDPDRKIGCLDTFFLGREIEAAKVGGVEESEADNVSPVTVIVDCFDRSGAQENMAMSFTVRDGRFVNSKKLSPTEREEIENLIQDAKMGG